MKITEMFKNAFIFCICIGPHLKTQHWWFIFRCFNIEWIIDIRIQDENDLTRSTLNSFIEFNFKVFPIYSIFGIDASYRKIFINFYLGHKCLFEWLEYDFFQRDYLERINLFFHLTILICKPLINVEFLTFKSISYLVFFKMMLDE